MPKHPKKEALRKGLNQLVELPVSFVGLGFFRAWISLLTNEGLLSGLNGPFHDGVLAAVLIALALLSPRLAPLFRKNPAVVLCLALASGAAGLVLILANGSAGTPAPFGRIAAILAACASAMFILMWSELYCALDITTTALSLALAMILAEGLSFLLAGMTGTYRLGALVALPLISILLLLRARRLVPNDSSARPSATFPRALDMRHLPWNLIALVGIYGLTSGLRFGVTDVSVPLFEGIANTVAGLLVLGAILFFPSTVNLTTICRSPAVLLIPALLLPLAGNTQSEVAVLCMTLSSSLFGLAIFLVLCDISHVQRIPATLLFSIEEATAGLGSVGTLLGEQGARLAGTGISLNAALAVAIALTVMAGLYLFNGERLAQKWGTRILGPGKMARDARELETLKTICEEAANARELTPREREVLHMLARNATIKEICEELGVAKGTAKAHCEHIYTKMGVRSKRELIRLLGIKP